MGAINHTGLSLVFEPITFPRYWHDMRMMQQSIQERCRQRRILRERRIPLSEQQVTRHDQTAFFIQRCDHLKEQVRLLSVHRQIAYFIDDQQPVSLDGSVHHRF